MRKYFVAVLLISLIASIFGTSAAAYDGANRLTVEAQYASSITVDGNKDAGYGKMYAVEQQGVAHTEGFELTTGNVAVAWNESEIYFYVEVYDQGTPFAVSTTDWKTDGPEFFLDLLNNKAPSYDDMCFRVRVIAAKDTADSVWDHWLSFNGSGKEDPVNCAASEDFRYAVRSLNGKDWNDGYAVELSYKYSNYMEPITNGYLMGWEVQICDDIVGLGNRDSQAFLGNPADVAWSKPAEFGSEIKFVGAPETAAAPASETPARTPAEDVQPTTAEPVVEQKIVSPSTFDNSVIIIAFAVVVFFASLTGIKKAIRTR